MTVLQKIKSDLIRFKNEGYLSPPTIEGLNIAIEQVEKYLEAEEQQIRDTFKVGQDYEAYTESAEYGIKEPPPDLETHITNLKNNP